MIYDMYIVYMHNMTYADMHVMYMSHAYDSYSLYYIHVYISLVDSRLTTYMYNVWVQLDLIKLSRYHYA